MEKSDLKNGMIVRLRNNSLYMVFENVLINNGESWSPLKDYENNLEFKYPGSIGRELDIIEVYKERTKCDLRVIKWFESIEDEEPIWRKEEEEKWGKVPEWTKVQVRDEDDEEWRNAYFLGYIYKEDSDFRFEVSFYDEFTYDQNNLFNELWKQCRLYKED